MIKKINSINIYSHQIIIIWYLQFKHANEVSKSYDMNANI